MKTVSIFELRDNLASLMQHVTMSQSPVVINRFGKPLAMLVPYDAMRLENARTFFGFLPKGETGQKALDRLRHTSYEEKRIKARREGKRFLAQNKNIE